MGIMETLAETLLRARAVSSLDLAAAAFGGG